MAKEKQMKKENISGFEKQFFHQNAGEDQIKAFTLNCNVFLSEFR